MIKSIHFDLDNCLIYSAFRTQDVGQDHIILDLEGGESYLLFVKPCAKRVIDYARSLVGPENVYILTTSMRHYALKINELADFGFDPKNIRAREDYYYPIRVGYGEQYVTHEKFSKDNVLIDDMMYEGQRRKVEYIGNISKENYLQCREYYGVNFPNDPFEKNVYKFLDERMISNGTES